MIQVQTIISVLRHSLLTLIVPLLLTSCSNINIFHKRDADNDGVNDKQDKCPDTPQGVGADVNGCPVDTDGDGVQDYQDKCPDVKGLVNLQGCPDADGDGVADNDDKCPGTLAGVKVDANGCPLDSDGDGVEDFEDRCPDRAGPASNKGCPEIKAETQKVLDEATKYINFDLNKATLKPSSYPRLEQIVQVLNDYPDFTLSIAGHSDNKELTGDNGLQLSHDRAAAARMYMLSKGIPAERIEARGYGETKPIADNRTAAGQAMNRRVEFDLYLTGETNAAEAKYGSAPVIGRKTRKADPAKGNATGLIKKVLKSDTLAVVTTSKVSGQSNKCFEEGSAVYNTPRRMVKGRFYNIVLSLVGGVVDTLRRDSNGTLVKELLPKTTITSHHLIIDSYLGVPVVPNQRNIILERMKITPFMSVDLSADSSYLKIYPEKPQIFVNVKSDTIVKRVWRVEARKAGERLPLNFIITGSCGDISLKDSKPFYKTIEINVTDPPVAISDIITQILDWLRKNLLAIVAILGALSAIYAWFKRVKTVETLPANKP